jgi:hypothetical protein
VIPAAFTFFKSAKALALALTLSMISTAIYSQHPFNPQRNKDNETHTSE